jgi:ethanolamine permease
MGWNYSVEKGGALGSLIACWIIGLLYTCVAVRSRSRRPWPRPAGCTGQTPTGPLMAFNVGLYLVLATPCSRPPTSSYSATSQDRGLRTGAAADTVHAEPFVLLAVSVLAFLNYRGVFMTLTVNFLIRP